jgi:hypothetical protein
MQIRIRQLTESKPNPNPNPNPNPDGGNGLGGEFCEKGAKSLCDAISSIKEFLLDEKDLPKKKKLNLILDNMNYNKIKTELVGLLFVHSNFSNC